jgi:hypothetical protein
VRVAQAVALGRRETTRLSVSTWMTTIRGPGVAVALPAEVAAVEAGRRDRDAPDWFGD